MRKAKNEEIILKFITDTCIKQNKESKRVGCFTNFIADSLGFRRTNVSSALNKLSKEGKVIKIKGKPVIYKIDIEKIKAKRRENLIVNNFSDFYSLIGSDESLKDCVKQAKAAILYPPKGLHTLLLGDSGVGKTMFAELMYKFAINSGVLDETAPFISFNCADYANNPQLLLSYLFGVRKGTYTGADVDRDGIVEKANNGILFLDEVHRLPPEGQEILFYLIDKGEYKPLGEVEGLKKVNILIICATTEKKENVLLSTFIRRIPMVISLPSLAERTFKERFKLINEFFYMEAYKTNKDISITSESVKSLLLYNCVGNVGQLKNDIQLCCANGFLKCIVNRKDKIAVDIMDLPENVKRGLLNYKKNKNKIDSIVMDESTFYYSPDGKRKIEDINSLSDSNTFYNNIENRISELKGRGISQEDVYTIMSVDIDKYFKKYIYKINTNINTEEFSKVVDKKIIFMVEKFLRLASEQLNRIFIQKIFYGLCLHISSSIERIKQNKIIVNHKINEIKEKYPEEYKLCLNFAKEIENIYDIHVPEDEVGFIAMFITDDFLDKEYDEQKPVVLIAMHGETTASSMADVVNKLIGGKNTFSYDMSLDKSTTLAYKEIKECIININCGAGVMLLADMGSLAKFGELISKETGIKIKAINMVSTLVALEVSRKALMGNYIEDIYYEIINNNNFKYDVTDYDRFDVKKENVIITLCITGEGSAIKLKNMIESNVSLKNKNIEILPMSILDKEDMLIKIRRLVKEKNILAIVGTVNPEIHGIPFIPASELFTKKKYAELELIINNKTNGLDKKIDFQNICSSIIEAFKGDINNYNLENLKSETIEFLKSAEKNFNIRFSVDTVTGLVMHIFSSIERIKVNKSGIKFKKRNEFIENNSKGINILKKLLNVYQVEFDLDEVCYIYSIIVKA